MKQWKWFKELDLVTRKRWTLFALYCWFNALLFFGFVVVALINAFAPAFELRLFTNLMYLSSGALLAWTFPLFVVFFIAPLLPRETWAWRFNLMVICFGIASLYLAPVAIIVLAFWLSDEIQEAYHYERYDRMHPEAVWPSP